ncbi:hypothetical protein RMQ97_09500 [Maricaulis sp. D1M11]|uniref:hypothetical protein n=1 Tax=Maricaulis sp. D1M11 TaxID=3076117 RepID=UPI0039B6E6A8
MLRLILTALAFMAITFGVQGLSHFVINVDHYAQIRFARPDPVMPMGFAAMLVQSLIMGMVMSRFFPNGATLRDGIGVSGVFGLFLASYIVLAEPAKYAAPSIPAWMLVEATASTIQFGVFGVILGLIHRKR